MQSNSPNSNTTMIGKRSFNQRFNDGRESADHCTDDMRKIIKQEWEKQNDAEDDEDYINSNSDSESAPSDEDMKQNHDLVEEQNSLSQQHTGKLKKQKRSSENKKLVFLSKKVLEEVMQKGETTGTNIANQILEIYKQRKMNLDFKNVQRRVYDALNVLHALDIIAKDRNKITYKGYSHLFEQNRNQIQHQNLTNSEKAEREKEIKERKERINEKREYLMELMIQQIALKKLVQRNFEQKKEHREIQEQKVYLPFVVVKMQNEGENEILMSENKDKLIFNCSNPVQLFNENHILDRIGITKCNNEQLQQMIPPKLIKFLVHKLNLIEDFDFSRQDIFMDHNSQNNINLLCDEPLTSIEFIEQPLTSNFPNQLNHDQEANQIHENHHSHLDHPNNSILFSQSSPHYFRTPQNNQFFGGGYGDSSIISKNNSIGGTPIKMDKYNNHNNQSSKGLSLNHFSLTSPYLPVKEEQYEIKNSFNFYNNQYFPSPLMTSRYDVFVPDEDSTKNYSNQTAIITGSKIMGPPLGTNHPGQIGNISPINFMNCSQTSIDNQHQTPQTRLYGKSSPAGLIPNLSQMMKKK